MRLLPLLILISPHLSRAFYSCNGPFCPPLWQKPKNDLDEAEKGATLFLGRDQESGCICRLLPQKWTICFGRDICKHFPKNMNITTTAMKLKSTQIFEIERGDLVNSWNLEVLEIDGNYNLTRIETGSFLNMTKLMNLSVSGNPNLKLLEKGSFSGLRNLRQLSLINNGFAAILDISVALGPTFLPQLSKLELSRNHFYEIGATDFNGMWNSSLKELNLILCQIEYIHPEAFTPLTNLSALRLGENSFNSTTITAVIRKVADDNIPLKLLNLYSAGFRKSPPKELLQAIARSNITRLSLARNQFEIITTDSFPHMPNLEFLDLREVLALNITNDAFAKLSNLKILLLSGNKLSSIPEGALLAQLTYLDLQDNSGHPSFSSYFSLYGPQFINMRNLQGLNLGFNRINAIYNTTFKGLENLTVLGLKNGTIFYIANNSFSMLTKLVFLNLENNFFLKTKHFAFETLLFQGLISLEVLLLGGCEMSSIPNNFFRGLTNLKHLGLERNKLVALSANDLQLLGQLQSIDFSQNNLHPWEMQIFSKNSKMQGVVANGNKFNYLSEAMLQDFTNLSRLELTENPFTCDCATFKIYSKVQVGHDRVLELLKNQMIYCAFPSSLTNQTLPQFLSSHDRNPNLCNKFFSLFKLIVIIPLLIFTIILFVAALLIYYYRWHFRYWVFLGRLYLTKKSKAASKYAYTNYMYDAFVSYSNEDRNFVIRLVTMLENYPPFLKLCVYERDFQIGTMISESVLESVAKSRRTLLIISDSYVKSHWCRWESQIAEHHRLFFRNDNGEYADDSLVLIKLGPVSESHLTPTLKYLLKTRIYLQWDLDDKKQKMFWEKLRGALTPAPEINENTYL